MQIDIIGGGASGLASAWYLAKGLPSARLRVWEQAETPGGLAGSFRTEQFSVEKFYHHIFKRDTGIQQLIGEMGLADELVWRPAGTGAYYFQQPFRLSTPLDVLRFTPLPLWDRFRLGLLVLHARTVRDWEQLDDETAVSYLRRIAGEKVYRVVWEPLFRGKFGQYAEEVSAAWLWSKLVDRGGSRNASGHEYLGYLKGGMGRLFETVLARLREQGHTVYLGTGVDRLEVEGGKVVALHAAGQRYETDLVIAATQLPQLVDLLLETPELASYRAQLQQVRFLGNVCLVLSLKHSLSDFYWTNVTDPEAPFVGIVEQSNWALPEEFGGRHLVYLSAYVAPGDPRYEMDAGQLLDHYLPHVQKLFPAFRREWVLESWAWRAPYAQPVVTTGYRHLRPATDSPLPNLKLCTMAQIYPSDRQVSNGIDRARELAEKLGENWR